jgi:hypothetical protein
MTDDSGVMGNLPRARPGRRSDKRGSASAKPSTGGRAKASTGARTAKRPAAAPRPATPKPKARAGTRNEPSRPTPERHDPVTDAVRIGVRIAGAGLGLAAGIARRLPRP